MDLEENKAVVRRYYQEVLTGRDRDLLTRLLDSSFVSHVPSGPAAGAGAYIAAVDAMHAAFPDLVVTVQDQVAEQDKVVTRWSAAGTMPGTSRACLPPAAESPSPASTSIGSSAGG
jgi:predicted ester cyclase